MYSPGINVLLGFIKSPRATKRLKDIVPEDVVLEGASSASEAEDSDVNLSPTKRKQPLGKHLKKKKGKKSDGWIWLEGLTRGQHLGDESKLAEYKKESKWRSKLMQCSFIHTDTCAR